MTLVANFYLTHAVMLACALVATYIALPEAMGEVIRDWRLPTTALFGAVAALALIAYPTWGELKNPGLWMFAIVAAVIGVARGHWLRIDVDHGWRLMRLHKALDGPLAAGGLALLAAIEIALAIMGPNDQPTMELGMTVLASFLVGRAGAVLLRARHEPQVDLHDNS
ncbi:MAG: hypothetical protein ISP49_12545 [Reyranella sp.]|nr:hypothetical protein [Reyranella sp.]MBL6652419.1 hypothetical protein [Reyranella sp.]